jgi:hypothetical protein
VGHAGYDRSHGRARIWVPRIRLGEVIARGQRAGDRAIATGERPRHTRADSQALSAHPCAIGTPRADAALSTSTRATPRSAVRSAPVAGHPSWPTDGSLLKSLGGSPGVAIAASTSACPSPTRARRCCRPTRRPKRPQRQDHTLRTTRAGKTSPETSRPVERPTPAARAATSPQATSADAAERVRASAIGPVTSEACGTKKAKPGTTTTMRSGTKAIGSTT